VNALPSKAPDHRVAYGPDSLQFGELRLPSGPGPFPVAVVVHGGCWVSTFATLQNTAALADALRDEGIATWNLEYRRIDNPGGGWPGTFEDVARGTDYLRDIAAEYRLDLGRAITIGHSAGGHLALWLAARDRIPVGSALYAESPLVVRGAVALGGAGDLAGFDRIDQDVCGQEVIVGLMGGRPTEVPERYASGSPIELLPFNVPAILITGALDEAVPKRFGEAFARAASEAGGRVEHHIVESAGHHEYNAPASVAWPTVFSAVREVLGETPPS
jgi:acetyl esterase/lipase